MIIPNESRVILIPLHLMISIACSTTEFSSIQSKIYNQTCEATGEMQKCLIILMTGILYNLVYSY